MTRWFGPALLAVTLMFAGPTAIKSAAAAPVQAAAQKSQATDVSARRHYRHYRYAYRPYYRPHYYARPYYYRPYPYYAPYYAPAPFGFGFGFGW